MQFILGQGRGLNEDRESGARYLGGAVPVQSAGLAGGRPPA
jgi:hypothetical protein